MICQPSNTVRLCTKYRVEVLTLRDITTVYNHFVDITDIFYVFHSFRSYKIPPFQTNSLYRHQCDEHVEIEMY